MKTLFLLPFLALILNVLTIPVNNEDDECPICYREMDGNVVPFTAELPDTAVVQPFECRSHSFHFSCATRWMDHGRHPTCPICRANVLETLRRSPDALSFILACRNGNIEVVREFLAQNQIIGSTSATNAFYGANDNGHLEILKLLLENPNLDPSRYINHLFQLAISNGQVESAIILSKDSRIDPKFTLNLASFYEKIEIVQAILDDPRIDLLLDGDMAVTQACVRGHIELVKFLMNDYRLSNESFSSGLKFASINGHSEIVKLLVRSDRVDLTNSESLKEVELALTWSSRLGYIDVIKILSVRR